MSDIPDRVSLDLVMELVEIQVGQDPNKHLIALALGVTTHQVDQYLRRKSVPRDRAEWLYDRVARGIQTQAPTPSHWEWELDQDERSEIARQAQYKWQAKQKERRAS